METGLMWSEILNKRWGQFIVARLLANGNVAFIESCIAIGWKDCDSVIGS